VACKAEPVICRRDHIARVLGLRAGRDKSWQFTGPCPACGHGAFSVTAPDQGFNSLRHIWNCTCRRDACEPARVRQVMVAAGVSEDCLGGWKRKAAQPSPGGEAAVLRGALREVLADAKVRAMADLRLRVQEVIEGEAVPGDWAGFLAFAERAGVQRSQRYEAAARWGCHQRQF
jgi:hypothetical protein